MYQALYRKWRPRTFDDVVGQSHITETIKRQIVTGRLSHAYLFVGTRGTGKTTCAKILAKAANCENPIDGNPCNRCPSCLGIDSGAILDVEELDAASNNGVDNIRMLREDAIYTPASAKKRVYIVDEVHMLSTAAFNALLKILEEPPEHLIFILATTELHKVPATILSRCQRFAFKRIPNSLIISRLKYVAEKENLDLTDDAAEMLANLSDGALRDALSLLDQCSGGGTIDRDRILSVIGLAGSRETAALMDGILSGDAANSLTTLDRLYRAGKDMASVLSELLSLYRDALMIKVAGKSASELLSGLFDGETLRNIADRAGAKRLLRGTETIEKAIASMMHSSDVKISAEMCVIMLTDETLMDGNAGLEARITRLESGYVPAPQTERRAPVRESKPEPRQSAKPVNRDLEDAPFDTEGAIIEDKAPVRPQAKPIAPAPEPVQEKPAPTSDNGAWQAILAAIASKIDKPTHIFLSNEMHAVADIQGNVLNIGTKSAIAKNMIDTTNVKTELKNAAERVLGRSVTVNVGAYTEKSAENEDKLDRLLQFGNIKFE